MVPRFRCATCGAFAASHDLTGQYLEQPTAPLMQGCGCHDGLGFVYFPCRISAITTPNPHLEILQQVSPFAVQIPIARESSINDTSFLSVATVHLPSFTKRLFIHRGEQWPGNMVRQQRPSLPFLWANINDSSLRRQPINRLLWAMALLPPVPLLSNVPNRPPPLHPSDTRHRQAHLPKPVRAD